MSKDIAPPAPMGHEPDNFGGSAPPVIQVLKLVCYTTDDTVFTTYEPALQNGARFCKHCGVLYNPDAQGLCAARLYERIKHKVF